MKTMEIRKLVRRFAAQRRAVTAIEYALLSSLVALAIVGGVTAAGTGVGTTLNSVSTTLATATNGGTSGSGTSGSGTSGSGSTSGGSGTGSGGGGGDGGHHGDGH